MFRSLLCVIALASSEGAAYSEQTVRVLDANVYHLGTPGFPEWEEFAKSQAHGRRLDIQFKAEPNSTPQILFIRQRQVKARWVVMLNNQRLGNLLNIDSKLVHSITVPPGKLKAGLNTLSIVAPKTTDDIEVGPITLTAQPEAEIFSASLNVNVTNKQTGRQRLHGSPLLMPTARWPHFVRRLNSVWRIDPAWYTPAAILSA